jgi:hypothetical protein
VHGGLGRKPAKNHESAFRRSNRDQTETPNSTSKSLTYDILMFKHWDTTDIQSLVTKKKSANPYELAGLVKTPNHALGRLAAWPLGRSEDVFILSGVGNTRNFPTEGEPHLCD